MIAIRCGKAISISIHPPREGWDFAVPDCISAIEVFQSTHPVRGGTLRLDQYFEDMKYFNPPTP